MKLSSDVTADLAVRDELNMNISQRPNNLSTFILGYMLLRLGLQSGINCPVNFPEILDTFQDFWEILGSFQKLTDTPIFQPFCNRT